MEVGIFREVEQADRSINRISECVSAGAMLKMVSDLAASYKMSQVWVESCAKLSGFGFLASAFYGADAAYRVTHTRGAFMREMVRKTAETIELITPAIFLAVSAHSHDPICLQMVLGSAVIHATSYAITQLYDPAARQASLALRQQGLF